MFKISIVSTFFFIVFIFATGIVAAQNDNCHVRISVLTCSPGEELYSTFGHSALRIIDSIQHTDIVYNWGTFDMEQEGFYLKFMRGKLLYFLSPEKFDDFLYQYQYEQRSVTEQLLTLSCEEKNNILKSLAINMQGNNRFYKYDFLFDNCTTRIRDMVANNVKKFEVHKEADGKTTFRNMLHYYLDNGGQAWSKLGIDILLGSNIDRPVTKNEMQFLPEYYMAALDESDAAGTKMIGSKQNLFTALVENATNKYVPHIIFTVICGLLLVLSFQKSKGFARLNFIVDKVLVYITGVVGALLLFMWLGTDHLACADNYNLLWALPTNIIAAFFMMRNPKWLRAYFRIASGLSALLLISWIWLPQELNWSLIPLVVLLLVRYYHLSHRS